MGEHKTGNYLLQNELSVNFGGMACVEEEEELLMVWHIIQGEAGCRFAVERKSVVVVVDALRASATVTMLLDAGAADIVVVGEVETALAARRTFPGALLYGERDGLPPEGFDYGNSPRTVSSAKGRRVVFTTTTGAQRLLASWGASALFMGTTLNASAVAAAARNLAEVHGCDVVLIPAGLATDPAFSAQEDWVAATVIAMKGGAVVVEGGATYGYWRERVECEGVVALFASAPHAEKLRRVNLEQDIAYSAQVDITQAVPVVVERVEPGLVLRRYPEA